MPKAETAAFRFSAAKLFCKYLQRWPPSPAYTLLPHLYPDITIFIFNCFYYTIPLSSCQAFYLNRQPQG